MGGTDASRTEPAGTDPVGTAVTVPATGLVVLVGVSGSGKSTFAARHFAPTEVVSSDTCRALVADDPDDQGATEDAFDLLHHLVGIRLRRGLLTVVDATNVQPAARASLVALARRHHVLVDAVVLRVPVGVAVERHTAAGRTFGPTPVARVVERHERDLKRSLRGLRREGFRRVHVLDGQEEIDAATVERERSWNDRRDLRGPFDLVGDVHGCASELRTLLVRLGWRLEVDERGRAVGAHHPEGRTAVFVGDLVDRGPDTPGVLRLVSGMVAAGTALCVRGNHEDKLVRALAGRDVKVAHGLAESLAQLAEEPAEERERLRAFMDSLVAHYVLDDGRLVVAHAGLKEKYHGRSSRRVRAFALYGDTTGETDEMGLPVRYPWAEDYRGAATVVYGHTPVPTPVWVNNTICLDTGVVFGGALTALRYPERELVDVPAEQEWYAPVRPLAPVVPVREPAALAASDVLGTRWIDVEHGPRVKVTEEAAAAALEVMSRFAADPRWVVHLPPTMAPVATSATEGFLEHPAEAFAEYAAAGVRTVVCEEKHMGSRAVAVLARDAEAAARCFGVDDGTTGQVLTRTGRPFFAGEEQRELVARLTAAALPVMDALDSDWVVLDAELLPWSAKAGDLVRDQYASVGAAAGAALPVAQAALDAALARGLDDPGLVALAHRTRQRTSDAAAFRDAYRAYVRPTAGLDGVTVAPFAVLAAEGEAYAATRPHRWHLEQVARMHGHPLVTPTRTVFVDLGSDEEREAATRWWLDLTGAGGEGMVVKPADHEAEPGARRRVQPGVKVRGREYLRIIYGPDYLGSLDLLRQRSLGRKRDLALREHGLGLDALVRFVDGAPLWDVHQRVFAVLALESDPVDPRL